MLPGVFRLGGVPRTWHQRVMAVCLWAGEEAAVSHRAAAALHRLDGFGLPTQIDVVVPSGRKPPNHSIRVHRPQVWSAIDRTKVAGIGVTTCVRTLIDLAGEIAVGELEIAIEDARRRRLIKPGSIQSALQPLPANQPGRAKLSRILQLQEGRRVTDSALEVKALRLLRREGYPEPTRQEVLETDGRFLGRVDLIYPERRLVIEVDGYVAHSGRGKFDSDRERGNGVTAHGEAVLHFTSAMLRGANRARFLDDLRRTYDRALPTP